MDTTAVAVLVVVLVAVALILLVRSSVVIRPYEAGVVSIFGSFRRVLPPGLSFVQILAHVDRVDLRDRRWDVPPTPALSRDAIPVSAGATLQAKVSDPVRALYQVRDYSAALVGRTQDLLRVELGQVEAARMAGEQRSIADRVRASLAVDAAPWGIAVQIVEINALSVATRGEVPSAPTR